MTGSNFNGTHLVRRTTLAFIAIICSPPFVAALIRRPTLLFSWAVRRNWLSNDARSILCSYTMQRRSSLHMIPSPSCSGVLLTRKQQWRRIETRKTAINFLQPQDTAMAGQMSSVASPAPLQPSYGPGQSTSKRDIERLTYKSMAPGVSNKPTPGRTTKSKCDLDAVDVAHSTERHRRCTSVPSPPLTSSEVTDHEKEGTDGAAREKRAVSFDRCVRVVLVPTRHELDAISVHDIWWGREDARQFRHAAIRFQQEHGTLSGVTDEELEETGPPPGMPPFLPRRGGLAQRRIAHQKI